MYIFICLRNLFKASHNALFFVSNSVGEQASLIFKCNVMSCAVKDVKMEIIHQIL